MSSTNSTTSAAGPSSTSANGPLNQVTPPLLPAFLITGLLLLAIIFIIVWRHFVERRALQQQHGEDPIWPSSEPTYGPLNRIPPKLWEPQFVHERRRTSWDNIMPLSVSQLRGKPKPRAPRYLIPSDRPISFFMRMFRHYRRDPQLPPPPPIASLTQQHYVSVTRPDDEEGPVEQLQVAVLIALPHPHCGRRRVPDSPAEKDPKEDGAAEYSSTKDPSPDKGKKRSLEMPPYVPTNEYDCDDEDERLEMVFGTTTLPFANEWNYN